MSKLISKLNKCPNFSELNGCLPDSTIYVVCYGTSLTGFNWEKLRDKYTICVNDAILKVPDASFHLFSDNKLINRYTNHEYSPHTMLICQIPTAEKIYAGSQPLRINREHIYSFRRRNSHFIKDIKRNDNQLYMSRTVAMPAIQFAWKLGAQTIYLLGHDCYDLRGVTYCDGTSQNQRDICESLEGGRVLREKHKLWARQNEALRKYFEKQENPPVVYNLSEHSTVDSWEKKDVNVILP